MCDKVGKNSCNPQKVKEMEPLWAEPIISLEDFVRHDDDFTLKEDQRMWGFSRLKRCFYWLLEKTSGFEAEALDLKGQERCCWSNLLPWTVATLCRQREEIHRLTFPQRLSLNSSSPDTWDKFKVFGKHCSWLIKKHIWWRNLDDWWMNNPVWRAGWGMEESPQLCPWRDARSSRRREFVSVKQELSHSSTPTQNSNRSNRAGPPPTSRQSAD